MSWASTAPDAMAALVVAFGQIVLDGEVRDGPAVGDASAREVITVGHTGPDDDVAVEDASTAEGLAGQDRENYDIHCAISVLSGDESVPDTRARAFALFAACGAVVVANPKLGGAVMQARISSWALREDMTTGGSQARLRFDVACDAYARR